MMKSMTGYGRAKALLHNREITVEIRSVNNRYLDCSIKLPRLYGFAEDALKNLIQKSVARGKVDVYITVNATAADISRVSVNRELAGQYIQALQELAEMCPNAGNGITPDMIIPFPDIFTVTREEENLDEVKADLCAVLEQALASYNEMRITEGAKLAEDISGRLDAILLYTAQVEERSLETVREYREKLTARMLEVLRSTSIDQQRILTEAAIYADKVAVNEETVRLRSHVSQIRAMMEANEPMGRKMDFLIQEINREANTIGSKCGDVTIAQIAVGLKAEVEKMREQVQNIE